MVIPPTIEVANLGMADSLILMVMALVVFGPRRLPQIGRQIGKLMYEFRKASNDFKFQMEEELRTAEEADRRKKEEEERQRQLTASPPAQIEASTSTTTDTPTAPAPEPAAYESRDSSRDPYAYGYGELTEEQIRIQPPSTGEQVAAERPAAATATETAAAEAEAAEAEVPEAEAAEAGAPTAPVAPTAVEIAPEQAAHEIATGTKSSAKEDADKNLESATHNG